jgi:hypothetical protein
VGRVAVGANGTILVADSTQAAGVDWTTVTSGASSAKIYFMKG